jgi:hypothetical protein
MFDSVFSTVVFFAFDAGLAVVMISTVSVSSASCRHLSKTADSPALQPRLCRVRVTHVKCQAAVTARVKEEVFGGVAKIGRMSREEKPRKGRGASRGLR